MDARQSYGSARRGRSAGVRDDGLLADLEADRRCGPCDRRHQRKPHHADGAVRQRLGQRAMRLVRDRSGFVTRDRRQRRSDRHHRSRPARSRHPDLRSGRRSAIGDHRPGLPEAGRHQGNLRHRRLHPVQQRRRSAPLRQSPAVDGPLPDRRQAQLCAGRERVRRRQPDAVAAGLGWTDRYRGRKRGIDAVGRGQWRRLYGPRPVRPWRAPLAARGPRADQRYHLRHDQGASGSRRAGGTGAPGPCSASCPARRYPATNG